MDRRVKVVYEDPDAPGTLWVGTETGLNRYRDGVLTPHDAVSVRVFSILRDRAGDLWIGAEPGLHRLRDGAVTVYTIRLNELAAEAVALMHGPIHERGVEVEIGPDLPRVWGDRTRLLEVFENLIENAVKFMGDQPSPQVEIGARQQGGETFCFVKDNGIGIAPVYQEKVFGLFDRLNLLTEGTGIGLALVKQVVELHGGRVWVEFEGGRRGSKFCLTLSQSIRGEGL